MCEKLKINTAQLIIAMTAVCLLFAAAGCTAKLEQLQAGSSLKGEGAVAEAPDAETVQEEALQTQPEAFGPKTNAEPETSANSELVGSWRAYSEAIFYDAGGNDWLDTPSTRRLELKGNGRWEFGSSTGTWETAPVTENDWLKWEVESYGPTRKIVLNNWNKGVADGPVEESGGRIDFIWVIYHADPPLVSYPGQVQIKFGHA